MEEAEVLRRMDIYNEIEFNLQRAQAIANGEFPKLYEQILDVMYGSMQDAYDELQKDLDKSRGL